MTEMPRTLALMRHAKSAYPTGIGDHERPLNERGQRDARVAGDVLRSRLGSPQLVLVSTATRAAETWDRAAAAFPHPPQRQNDARIYDASVDTLLQVLRETNPSIRSLVLVGHNPGVQVLAAALSGPRGGDAARASMLQKYPTSALACLTVEVDWQHLAENCAQLTTFDIPRG